MRDICYKLVTFSCNFCVLYFIVRNLNSATICLMAGSLATRSKRPPSGHLQSQLQKYASKHQMQRVWPERGNSTAPTGRVHNNTQRRHPNNNKGPLTIIIQFSYCQVQNN